MMRIKTIMTFIFGILICACNSDQFPKNIYQKNIETLSDKALVKVVLYGKTLIQEELLPSKKNNATLINILREKENKWQEIGSVSYVSKLQFIADGLSVNIINDGIILNIKIENNKWKQYSADIAPNNLNYYIEQILQ